MTREQSFVIGDFIMQLSPDLKTQGPGTVVQGYFLNIVEAPVLPSADQEVPAAGNAPITTDQAISLVAEDLKKKYHLSRQQIIQILEDQVVGQMLVDNPDPERPRQPGPVLLRRIFPGSSQSEEGAADRPASHCDQPADIQAQSDQAAQHEEEDKRRRGHQGGRGRPAGSPHATGPGPAGPAGERAVDLRERHVQPQPALPRVRNRPADIRLAASRNTETLRP